MCILLTQEERKQMCQTIDECVIQLIKLTRENPRRGPAVNSQYALDEGLLYRKVKNSMWFVMLNNMRESCFMPHDLSSLPALLTVLLPIFNRISGLVVAYEALLKIILTCALNV